jgi:hypothetical protein
MCGSQQFLWNLLKETIIKKLLIVFTFLVGKFW